MALEFTPLELTEMKPKVAVVGVGGAGGNAVNNMVSAELPGVDFIAANTDAQALAQSLAKLKIQLGVEATEGLGAGSHPDVGRAAAEEAIHQIEDALSGCHMVFVTAGMGGGTGTGAAPVIARVAKNKGILTVGVVTKPFQFEGSRRMKVAEEGIYELQPFVDTLIVIPNQNLFRIASKQTTFAEAFALADDVLCSGVRGITDLMMMPGLINLDFADIRTIMRNMGTAMMGTGEASGEGRSLEAAETAIANPLLDEMSLASAKGVIVNITGGPDLTLFEVDEAASHIRKEVDENANIIVGSAFRDELQGRMRVSIVATGVTYLKGMSAQPEAADQAAESPGAGRLHFVPEASGEAAYAKREATYDEPVYDNESEARAQGHVGYVDDLEAEEAKPPHRSAARGDDRLSDVREDEPGAAAEAEPEPAEAEAGSSFVRDSRRNLFEESLAFAGEGEEDEPSLSEEAGQGDDRPSLFQRMAAGIKGIFTSGSDPAEERAEPAMGEFSGGEEEDQPDNVLNIEARLESQAGEPDGEAASHADKADSEAEQDEDQLAIPEFLRKQA